MPSDFARPLTIPAVLYDAAQRFPNRTAYVETIAAGQRSVTWAELRYRAEDTAAGFIALGLQRGDRVAICAENGIDWVVAYMAVALAGATGVLVYYELKTQEITEQVTRPRSRFLVASPTVLAKLPRRPASVETMILIGGSDESKRRAKTVLLEEVAPMATPETRAALQTRTPEPDDLAAIIYTSGTTGGAKGVMLSHRNFLENGRSAIDVLDVSEKDSILLVLPLHHAMPFLATCVLVPLLGAKVFIENDLRRVRDRLQEARPTVFFGVPALYDLMYRNVLARAETEGRLPKLLQWQARARRVKQLTGVNIGPLIFRPVHKALGGKLRFLVSGGAALNPQTARDFFSLGFPLLQGWGMTEATTAIALQRFSSRRFLTTRFYEQHAGSVGPALPGIEVRLIDVPEKDIRVSTRGEGEVIVRGPNVFRGYWDGEEETQSAMVDGWLRTGDLGRFDSEGNIYLTGRSKYVIVLESGEKVYPDEVEAKLAESDLIEDIVVVSRTAREKTQVGAVIYPRIEAGLEGKAADGDALRKLVSAEVDRLGRELAAYKRITQIELADSPLPKTALRKIARGQLAESYDSFDYKAWLVSGEESS